MEDGFKPTQSAGELATTVTLGAMSPGTSGLITGFGDEAEAPVAPGTEQRLREMGFAEGLVVEVTHQSPFGKDPIAVRVDGMGIALRRREATLVRVALS